MNETTKFQFNKIGLIIAGTRTFDDYESLKTEVNKFIKTDLHIPNPQGSMFIISGYANGPDKMGIRYAQELNIEYRIMKADWNKYGKSAGYVRNREMAKIAKACIVFWDTKSKGTENMIKLAFEYKLNLTIVTYSPEQTT
jgi:hypothetical protein